MNILGKYQNQCQAQLRETEIQKSVTKLFNYMLHHVCLYICVRAHACTHARTHRATQKSPHNGKMVSLFTKRALYGHHYIDITCGCVSPLTANYIWCYVRICISNAFF